MPTCHFSRRHNQRTIIQMYIGYFTQRVLTCNKQTFDFSYVDSVLDSYVFPSCMLFYTILVKINNNNNLLLTDIYKSSNYLKTELHCNLLLCFNDITDCIHWAKILNICDIVNSMKTHEIYELLKKSVDYYALFVYKK